MNDVKNPDFTLMAKVRCEENKYLHARTSTIVAKIAGMFQDTNIKFYRDSGASASSAIDPKSLLTLMMATINNGENIKIVCSGDDSALAANCLKIALENLIPTEKHEENLKNDTSIADNVYAKVEEYLKSFPDLISSGYRGSISKELDPKEVEYSVKATTNDNFHLTTTAPALVYVVREYSCVAELRFVLGKDEMYVIKIDPMNIDGSIDSVLSVDPPPGTVVAIVTKGKNMRNTAHVIAAILNNLKECDLWLRQKGSSFQVNTDITKLIELSRELNSSKSENTFSLPTYYMSDIINEQSTLVFSGEIFFSKAEAIRQLVNPHAANYGLDYDKVNDEFIKQENEMPLLLEGSLAMTHVTLPQGPRVSFSLGVFPRGVNWVGKKTAKIICMFVTATDTHRTYMNYSARMAKVFKSDSELSERIVGSKNAREVIRHIIAAEQELEGKDNFSTLNDMENK